MFVRSVVLLAVLSTLSGCALLSELLKSSAREPTFHFKQLNLTDVSLGGLTLDTVWELQNPNGVDISLDSVEYALFIEERQVIAGAPQNGLQIAAYGASELHFPAQVKFQDLGQVLEVFLNKDTAAYRASGAIGVRTPIGLVRLPLQTSGTFDVPKVPAVAFGNPRVSNMGLTSFTLEIPLSVTNRGRGALPVSEISGAVTLSGTSLGSISSGNLGSLGGGATQTVNASISVNLLQVGMAIAGIVQGNQARLGFDARLSSGPATVPVRLDQVVSILH